jgi:hypothetical protein
MPKRQIAWGALVAASLLLAACGGADPAPAPAEEGAADPATAASEVTAELAEPPTQTPAGPTVTVTVEPTETADDVQNSEAVLTGRTTEPFSTLTEQPADETPVPGRPSGPARGSAFRLDPVEVVAATGRPQLIEFFAFW